MVDDTGTTVGTNSNQLNGLCAGTYGAQVTDANGCTPAISAVVVSEPAAINLSATISNASCFGDCDGAVQINANGCSENISYVIDQPADLVFQSIVTTDAGCIPDQCVGSVQVNASGATKYSLDGVINLSGDFQNLCAGNYLLLAGNPAGCEITETITIDPEETPYANFTSFPSEMSLPDNEFSTYNTSFNSTSFEWTVQGLDFDYTSSEIGLSIDLPYVHDNYEVCLIASNQTLCKDTVCRLIKVRDEFTIWVPNSFSPDGDEFNNIFEPVISNVDSQAYDFIIFDRWGQLVFKSHDLNQDWDGTFNGSYANTGIYVWKIRLKSIGTDEYREYSVHVNLLK